MPSAADFDNAVAGLGAADLAALAQAAMQRVASLSAPQLVDDREQAARVIEGCAASPYAIPQWTTADGAARGVMVRALETRHRMDAARAAHVAAGRAMPTTFAKLPDGSYMPDPVMGLARDELYRWRLVCEETARMIVTPDGLTAEMLLRWNAEITLAIHAHGTTLAAHAPALVRAELAQLAGVDDPVQAPAPIAGSNIHDAVAGELDGGLEPRDDDAA